MSLLFPKRLSLRRSALLILYLLFLMQNSQAAESGAPTEYQVKTAFLYHFAKFVEWPPKSFATPNSPLVIGTFGKGAFDDYLAQINGKTIGSHPLVIKHCERPEQLRGCHIVFISVSERRHLEKVMEAIQSERVLTVCDEAENFAKVGGVINLVRSMDNKIHFQINVDAAKRAELKIDSTLLNLAQIVRDSKT